MRYQTAPQPELQQKYYNKNVIRDTYSEKQKTRYFKSDSIVTLYGSHPTRWGNIVFAGMAAMRYFCSCLMGICEATTDTNIKMQPAYSRGVIT